MSEAKHTPLPWGVHPLDDTVVVVGGRGAVVEQRAVAECYGRAALHAGTPDEGAANAALIVRAVNHHGALIAAAEQVLTLFNPAGRDLPSVALLREVVAGAKG